MSLTFDNTQHTTLFVPNILQLVLARAFIQHLQLDCGFYYVYPHIYRYAMALVQEMNVKVDKELIISLTSLFSQQKELLEEVVIVCHGSARN